MNTGEDMALSAPQTETNEDQLLASIKQADITAAIHELNAAPAKQPPNSLRGLLINLPSARTRPAEHANSSKHSPIVG